MSGGRRAVSYTHLKLAGLDRNADILQNRAGTLRTRVGKRNMLKADRALHGLSLIHI